MEHRGQRRPYRADYFTGVGTIILAAVLFVAMSGFTVKTFPPISQKGLSEEEKTRIKDIEIGFGVGFYSITKFVLSDGSTKDYWQFIIRMDQLKKKGFPFEVPPMATDEQVQDAVASSLATASFEENVVPTPTPVPERSAT